MSINPAVLTNTIQTTDFYSLDLKQNKSNLRITMKLFSKEVNTRSLPKTYSTLKKELPSVLHTQCFNDEGLPFATEVKRTEIGHLFEHILLEYLCLLKLANGHKFATFKGNTHWNWEQDPWGTFHIDINASAKDAHLMPAALDATIKLVNKILKPPSVLRITHATKI